MRGRLVSTTTVLERPWLKLCFTVPVLTEPPVRGFSVRGARAPAGSRSRPSCARLTIRLGRRGRPKAKLENPPRAGRADAPVRVGAPRANSQGRADGSRQPLDIECPALGAPPRKEGGVYHIRRAQGQTQFRRTEHGQEPAVGAAPRRAAASSLRRPSSAPSRGLDQPGRLARLDRRQHPLEPEGKIAGLARKPERRQQPRACSRRSTWSARSGRRRQLGLGGAGEQALLRRRLAPPRGRRRPTGRAPAACAPGPGPPTPSGPGDEAHQPRLVHHLAGDDVPALARRGGGARRRSSRRQLRSSPRFAMRPQSCLRHASTASSASAEGLVLFDEFFLDLGFRLDPAGGDAGAHDQAPRRPRATG